MTQSPKSLPNQATFADLIAALPELYEKPGTQRDYRFAIQRCAEIYGVDDLKDLPLVTPEAFDNRFPRNGFSPDQPFLNEGSYGAWRRKVRAPLQKYLDPDRGKKRENAPNDDWTRLFTKATAEAERLNIKPQRLISLRILTQEARKHDIRPQDLSPVLLERMGENLTKGRRKSLRQAFPLLERLRAGSDDIRSYLPSTHLVLTSQKGNAAPHHLLSEAEIWVNEHCNGEYDEIEEEYDRKNSEETKKTYLAAFRHYLDFASVTEPFTQKSTLSDALSKQVFISIMREWIKSPGGISLRSMSQYIKNIHMIAKKRGIDVTHMQNGLKKNRHLKEGKKAAYEIAEGPKNFCQWLLSDKKNQKLFMSLHIKFFKAAQKLVEAEQYRTLTSSENDDLRQLGTLAAMAAIWIWITPLRITNMMELTIAGATPKLHLPSGKRNYALLLIPAVETKTKRAIRKRVFQNRSRALEIIKFYIQHIRPRYPDAAVSHLLFPGCKDAYTPVNSNTVRKWLKPACRAIGFYPISPHFFRHGVASIFLKHNPGAYVHAGRMLDDKPRTVRLFYAFIDEEQLNDEAQIEMLKIAGFIDEEEQGPSMNRRKW